MYEVNGEKRQVATWKCQGPGETDFSDGKVAIDPAYAAQKLWGTDRQFCMEVGGDSYPVRF